MLTRVMGENPQVASGKRDGSAKEEGPAKRRVRHRARPDDGRHFEPYVCVSELTHNAVLLSWGGFYFNPPGKEGPHWDIVDDEQLDRRGRDYPHQDSIGARSAPYGDAVVHLLDERGAPISQVEVGGCNHAWLEGLEPDTSYRYRVFVDGQPWAEGRLLDWEPGRDAEAGAMVDLGRVYDMRFRTHPNPESATPPLSFAVIGDYGVGIRRLTEHGKHQQKVARAMERGMELHQFRFILTTGDNIYLPTGAGPKDPKYGSGEEDDDWFFSFYQPYRYLLSRVPFYPAFGNHDSAQNENADDREQLNDNFFLDERFNRPGHVAESSAEPGLFYAFRIGADLQFIAIDTTELAEGEAERYFLHEKHRQFIHQICESARCPRWLIPFGHHPPYCAGPSHKNDDAQIASLLQVFQDAGVKLWLAGHEHNFQASRAGNILCLLTGAGGQLRTEPPTRFEEARVEGYAIESHFLLVKVEERLEVTPVSDVDAAGNLVPVAVQRPRDLEPFPLPIVIA